MTVSQCSEAILKWLEDTQLSDTLAAFDFAFQNWTRSVSPPVAPRSCVEKDFRSELRMSMGSPSLGKGVAGHEKKG